MMMYLVGLDALYEADVSSLYQVMVERVVDTLGLASNARHLDITSFHVDGEYAVDEQDGETKRIELVAGPPARIKPGDTGADLWQIKPVSRLAQALSGNTNDQKALQKSPVTIFSV